MSLKKQRVLITVCNDSVENKDRLCGVLKKAAENLGIGINFNFAADAMPSEGQAYDVVFLISAESGKSLFWRKDLCNADCTVYSFLKLPLYGGESEINSVRRFFCENSKGVADFYDCDDTLLYRILTCLSVLTDRPYDICIKGKKLCVCGETLEEINLKKIADFRENEELNRLENLYVCTDMKRYLMQESFNEGDCQQNIYAEYVGIFENLKLLAKTLSERRNALLRAAIIKAIALHDVAKEGKCDEMLYAAFGLFAHCLSAQSEKICDELLSDKNKHPYVRIAAGLSEIALIESRGFSDANEILKKYDIILPLVKESGKMLFALCDYIKFLSFTNFEKAAEEVKSAKEILSGKKQYREIGRLCDIVGDMWYREAGFAFALGYYTESAEAYNVCNKSGSGKCLLQEAKAYAKCAKSLIIEKGLSDGAISMYGKAVEYAEKGCGKYKDELGEIYYSAAFACRCAGDLEGALRYGKAAKDILTPYYLENPAEYAAKLADACSEECAYYMSCDTPKAVKLAEQTIKLRTEAYVIDPVGRAEELAVDYCNFAKVNLADGNVADAYEYAVKSAGIMDRVYSNDPEDSIVAAARTYFDVGNICYTAEKYGDARDYMSKGLRLYGKLYNEAAQLFAEDYADACESYSAACKYGFGDMTEAEQYCKKAIEIRESEFIGQPERQVAALIGLYTDAICYGENKDDLSQIKKYLIKCADKERFLCDENAEECVPAIISAYVRLADYAAKEKDFHTAAEYYSKALKLCERVFNGKNFADEKSRAKLYLFAGLSYYRCGEEDKATGMLAEGVHESKRCCKEDNDIKPLIATACELSGDIYFGKGSYDDALSYYSDAVTACYGNGDETDARLIGKVADCYGRKGETEKQKAFLNLELRCVEKLHKKYDGKYTGYLMSVYASLAHVYANGNDFEKADTAYDKAAQLYAKSDRQKLLQAKICISASGVCMICRNREKAIDYLVKAEKCGNGIESVKYGEEKKKICFDVEKLFRMAGEKRD